MIAFAYSRPKPIAASSARVLGATQRAARKQAAACLCLGLTLLTRCASMLALRLMGVSSATLRPQ